MGKIPPQKRGTRRALEGPKGKRGKRIIIFVRKEELIRPGGPSLLFGNRWGKGANVTRRDECGHALLERETPEQVSGVRRI